MNGPDSTDRELRALFEQERHREASWTPSLERTLSRRAVRHPRAHWALAGLAAGVVIAAVLGVVLRRTRTPSEEAMRLVELKPGEWRTPTDFLLDVPGTDFLRKVPELGNVNGWFPLSGSPRDGGSRSSRL